MVASTVLPRSAGGKRMDEALVRAVRREMAIHKRLGLPIAMWRDGRAVWLPAEQIPVGVEEYEQPLSSPPAFAASDVASQPSR